MPKTDDQSMEDYIQESMEDKTFGQVLRSARERKGLSLKQLDAIAGKHWTYIWKIEKGEFKPPAADTIVTLSKALSIDSDEMMVLAGKAPPDIVHRLETDLEFVKDIRRKYKMEVP